MLESGESVRPVVRAQEQQFYGYLTVLLLIGATMFRLWYIASGALDLAPDEAHYWEWSRRLDWSYYSKGPMVAYLIAAFTRLGSSTDFFVRLPAVLLSLGTGILTYLLARELLASERAAFLTVLACSANPLYSAGSILMTIDAPMMFFWTLAAYSICRTVRSGRSAAGLRWWFVFGVALGCGVLSKYTMLLIVPCVGAYLLMAPRARPYLKMPAPYLALCIAFIICTPILIWNFAHDWVSLRHVGTLAGFGGVDDEAHFTAKTFFEFLGSQLAVVSPVLFVAVVVAMIDSGRLGLRARRDEHLLLFLLSAPPFIFFLLWSAYEKVEANWATPVYVTATVALAALWDEQLARGRRAAISIAFVLLPGFLMVALAHFPGLPGSVGLNLPPRVDLTRRLHGWKELGAAVGTALTDAGGERLFLISDHYQIASELAFYVPGQPRVYNIDAGRRMNQYDIWGGLDALRGRDGIFVTYGDWAAPPPVQAACETLHKTQVVETSHLGQPGQTFSIFRCEHYKGPPAAATRMTY